MADIVEAALLGYVKNDIKSGILEKLNCWFFENVEKLLSIEEFDLELKQCQSNEQRLTLCKKYFPGTDVLLSFFNTDVSGYRKSIETSNRLRNHGNDYFRQRYFTESLRTYNLALCFAPEDSSALPLALGNRSAVFVELDQVPFLEGSMDDMALALNSPSCPTELKTKLELRRDKVLKKMAAVKNVEQKTFSTPNSNEIENFKKGLLFKIQNTSEFLLSAESFVKIVLHPERGRELVVTKDVTSGTTLIVEKPYVKLLTRSMTWEVHRCHNCMTRILGGVPCKTCVFAVFCSVTCRDEAMTSFHEYECPCWPYFHQVDLPRYALLTFRLIVQLGPIKLSHLVKHPVTSSCSSSTYDPNSYQNIFNLVTHVKDQTDIDHFSNTMQTLLLVTLLDHLTPFFSQGDLDLDKETLRKQASALILRHLQNLPCNSLALEEVKGQLENYWRPSTDPQNIKTAKLEQFASGIYPTISLINHSCDPNVTRLTDSLSQGQMAIVTLNDLKAGQAIFTSYTKSFTTDPLLERGLYLKENYHFDCACTPCQEKWPLLPELLTLDPKFYKTEKRSSKSNRKASEKKLLTEWRSHVDEFYVTYDLVLQNQPLEAIRKLKPVLTFFQGHVKDPNGKSVLARETLKKALDLVVYF